MIKKQLLFLILVLFLASIFSQATFAETTINGLISQAAPGDTINVPSGYYNETVNVNKRINLIANGSVNVTKFDIYSIASNSTIKGFNINNPEGDGIYIRPGANNCQIIDNNINSNGFGIQILADNTTIRGNTINTQGNTVGWAEPISILSSNNKIFNNTLKATGISNYVVNIRSGTENVISNNNINFTQSSVSAFGISVGSSNNHIVMNKILASFITGTYGIDLYSSDNYVTGNDIVATTGVRLLSPNNHINFNRIISTEYAIFTTNNENDVLYNWYGSNNDPSSLIYGVNYNPWLVITINASPKTIYNGNFSTITVDFIHDSNGGIHDLVSGYFPNEKLVTFNTNLGTISNQTTVSGLAVSYLNASSFNGNATITANFDQETLNIPVEIIDNIPPTVKCNINGGLYNTNKMVSLYMNENGSIYYTTNGATPTRTSAKYNGPITMGSTTTLKFMAFDTAGNPSPVYIQKYIIDKSPPRIVSTNPKNSATKVSRTSTITIKLTENLKYGVNWSKIVIKNKYGKSVKFSKWISGNMLYLKTSKRSSYSYYTVYIPSSAIRDLAGNSMVKGYTFRFKTGR